MATQFSYNHVELALLQVKHAAVINNAQGRCENPHCHETFLPLEQPAFHVAGRGRLCGDCLVAAKDQLVRHAAKYGINLDHLAYMS